MNVAQLEHHRRGGRRRLRAPPRSPRDRPRRRRRLQPGRLRADLGRPGRPEGTSPRPGPAAGRRRAGGSGVLVAAGEPHGEGRGGAATPGRPPGGQRADPDQQQLPQRPHPRCLLHRLRPRGLRCRDGRQRGLRHRRRGEPGPPAGAPPHRRDRRRGDRLGAGPGAAPHRRHRHAGQRRAARPTATRTQGNAPRRRRVERSYEFVVRRHLGLPLPLRPQRP